MDRELIKKKLILILCVCVVIAGLWSVNNMMSGKAAGNQDGESAETFSKRTLRGDDGQTSPADDASVEDVTEPEASAQESRAETNEAALPALWTLDQTDLSEWELIRAAAEGLPEDALPESAMTEEEENEYADLAIANVRDYVNVRSLPGTNGEILGKIYKGAVAHVLDITGEDEEWFHVISGSVEGYIKAEYFFYGDAAAEVIDDYVTRKVKVKADRLNVRAEPDIESRRTGFLDHGEKALLLEDCGDWKKIQYAGEHEGYVASEYVTVVEEFVYAKSIEEERAEQEALRALRQRQEVSEEKAPENTNVTPPEINYTASGDLRADIVNYAMQFLGNRYVMGGNSLVNGTDCSGFTSLIYAEFGYSISRTPAGQLSSAGRGIDYSEIQPGDIICYSSNGGKSCTHVALYIGDGQIIHSANSRKGVVIYQAGYDRIVGVRNVID